VRLFGIDAPEAKQTCRDSSNARFLCGQVATTALREMVGKRQVTCEPRDVDRYQRIVAVCKVDGTDLGGWMVRHGFAVAYRQYGGATYDDEEAEARQAKRGLWAGTFTPPDEFRKARVTPNSHR
jgi:endonuclease YncB( thermonuclease family)